MARVLIACEFSGVVRDAFIARGHDAVSCDVLDTERPGPHLRCDVRSVLRDGWDLMIAFPPCTHLCRSGARWWRERVVAQGEAIDFVRTLVASPIPRVAVENPVGILSTVLRKPDQIVQPWWFGHPETKATCLWLHGLPPLVPTDVVEGRRTRVHHERPGPDRWRRRSRTLPGIAAAMAAQWG